MYKYRLFHCNNGHKVHTAPSIKFECNYKINNVAKIFLYFFSIQQYYVTDFKPGKLFNPLIYIYNTFLDYQIVS